MNALLIFSTSSLVVQLKAANTKYLCMGGGGSGQGYMLAWGVPCMAGKGGGLHACAGGVSGGLHDCEWMWVRGKT